MSVTFVASGNATLAAGESFATCSIGGVNYEAVLLADTSGSILGIAGNPLQVSGTFSACVASLVSASATIVNNSPACVLYTSACITNLSGSAAGSPLFVSVTNSPSVFVTSATASPIFTRLSDGADTVAVDAASRLLVTASLTDGLSVTAASVTVVNNSTACVLYTSACITNMAGSAAGSPLFTSVTNQVSASISNTLTVIPGASGASPWAVKVTDGNANAFGYGAASPFYTSVVSLAGSAAGSPLFASITNQVSASISNTVAVSQGASGTAPWGVRILDAGGSAYGYGAGSPLFTSVVSMAGSAAGSPLFVLANNLTGSAAGSPTFVSACITNLSGSAAGSPLFVSACITNIAGSAAGSPLFVSVTNQVSASISNTLTASAIQGVAACPAAAWPVRLSDLTDTAAIDSASRLNVSVTDGTNAFGLPASPFSVTGQGQTMYWAGSTLTIQQIDLSSSISGCTPIVASLAGFATVIVNATFTTSSCQLIGWAACGNNGGASATIQTRMPFGTNGGMDAKRSPDAYLWAFPSGSIAVLTTTSACVVAGTINYIRVAS